MTILAIDTSCDETAAAVTENTKVLTNIIWSQASLHAGFGGVMPSLAQRIHRERIDWVIGRAMSNIKCQMSNLDAIAVTVGPGLAIALEVGIAKAKELAEKYNKPLIPVNHIEGHLLGCLATPNAENFKFQISNFKFPMLGLVVSGGNTILVKVNKIGEYETLAQTVDDALGEALDKAARMLGLGYPGGAILEKFARLRLASAGQARYGLPIPLTNDSVKDRFSYSGLKTALFRLVERERPLTKKKICDLAAGFQEIAFEHILRVVSYQITNHQSLITNHFLLGGGVANNNLLRGKLRKLLKRYGITLHVPYSKKLCGDNAAMIGVTAYLKIKNQKLKIKDFRNHDSVDRQPRMGL